MIRVTSDIQLQDLGRAVTYPVALIVGPVLTDGVEEVRVCLSVAEAEALVYELSALVSTIREDSRSYVQVEFGPGGSRYTYIDPSGDLDIGDRVFVSGWSGGLTEATVVSTERGEYQGELQFVQGVAI